MGMEQTSFAIKREVYNAIISKLARMYAKKHRQYTTVYEHLKTGKYYFVINQYKPIIECTNGREDKQYVLYSEGIHWFCREADEFHRKFKKVNVEN